MIEWLEDYGHIVNRVGDFDFAIGMTGILQGSQNNQKNSLKGNNLNGSGSLDVTISSAFADYYVATAHLEAGVYNGLDNTFIYPLLFGKVDADDRNPGTNLAVNSAECYLEAKFFKERLSFSAGLLDATVFFDKNTAANDERSQFLNSGYKNNTTIDFPRNYAIGAIVKGKPGIFEFSAGILDAFASGMNLEDNPFWIAQAAVVPKFGELTHHFRV